VVFFSPEKKIAAEYFHLRKENSNRHGIWGSGDPELSDCSFCTSSYNKDQQRFKN